MSLLASTNSGSSGAPYFIENIGDPSPAGVPCIAGDSDGAVRVGDPETGLFLQGDRGGVDNFIRGGAAAGSTLLIGSSAASYQNIALSDALTVVNTDLVCGTALTPASGDIILTNGMVSGTSISGYYTAANAPQNVIDGAPDAAVPNPAGLTTGWYIVACQCAPGGQTQQQISTMSRYVTGQGWIIGGCGSNLAGAGRFGFNVAADRSTLALANSSGADQLVTVHFTKLLN